MLLLEESWSELFLLCSIQVWGKDPKNLKVHQIWIHSRYFNFNLSSFFYFQWCLPLPSPSLFSPVELPDLPPSLQVQANMIPPLHCNINQHPCWKQPNKLQHFPHTPSQRTWLAKLIFDFQTVLADLESALQRYFIIPGPALIISLVNVKISKHAHYVTVCYFTGINRTNPMQPRKKPLFQTAISRELSDWDT